LAILSAMVANPSLNRTSFSSASLQKNLPVSSMLYEERAYRKKANRKGKVRLFVGKTEKNIFSILQFLAKRIIKKIRKSRERVFSGKKKEIGGDREKYFSPYDWGPGRKSGFRITRR